MIFPLFFSELVALADNVDAPNAVTMRHESIYMSIVNAVEMVEFLRWECDERERENEFEN